MDRIENLLKYLQNVHIKFFSMVYFLWFEWLSDTDCKVDLGLTELKSKASADFILPQRRQKAIGKEGAKSRRVMTPATEWLMEFCLVSF